MIAGRLNKRVTIQAQTAGTNAIGEPTKTWTDVATVWASVLPLRGREFWAAQQVQAEQTVRIVIRYRSDVTSLNRVVHGSDIYNVLAVINPEEKNESLQLMCEKGPNEE